MSEAKKLPVSSHIRLLTGNSLAVRRNLLDIIICFIVINRIRLFSIGKYSPMGPDIVNTNMYFSQCILPVHFPRPPPPPSPSLSPTCTIFRSYHYSGRGNGANSCHFCGRQNVNIWHLICGKWAWIRS